MKHQHIKVLATIGPTSHSYDVLSKLYDAGMTGTRMNFSHGDYDYHGQTIANIRKLEKEKNTFIPIVLDTKGPEIRTGKLKDGKSIDIKEGQTIIVTTDDVIGDETIISISYKEIVEDIKKGMFIMIADGLLRLEVEEINGTKITCKAFNSATIGERKNVNLPGIKVKLPAMSEKDKQDLIFACEQKVDFVAASFIRKASDVREIRAHLDANGGKYIRIISKIENQEGIDNFEDILQETDGVMVARGDLGVDIALEQVPIAQKMMIERCNEVGKIVITATQMLESMTVNPRPTRAEVTDIANAILDGTDVVMLSGETANGKYPVESVKTMHSVANEITKMVNILPEKKDIHITTLSKDYQLTYAVAKGAMQTAKSVDAAMTFVASVGGTTVRALRKYNTNLQPLYVYTPHEETARQTQLIRSVVGVAIGTADSYEDLQQKIQELPVTKEYTGEHVLLVGGGSIGKIGVTDFVKVMSIE